RSSDLAHVEDAPVRVGPRVQVRGLERRAREGDTDSVGDGDHPVTGHELNHGMNSSVWVMNAVGRRRRTESCAALRVKMRRQVGTTRTRTASCTPAPVSAGPCGSPALRRCAWSLRGECAAPPPRLDVAPSARPVPRLVAVAAPTDAGTSATPPPGSVHPEGAPSTLENWTLSKPYSSRSGAPFHVHDHPSDTSTMKARGYAPCVLTVHHGPMPSTFAWLAVDAEQRRRMME